MPQQTLKKLELIKTSCCSVDKLKIELYSKDLYIGDN